MTVSETSTVDYSDLSALFINCTLKRSPDVSNTQGLADLAIAILEANGVKTETVRALDAAHLEPLTLALREPTLDDVFLSLTGHAAEEPTPSEDEEAPTPGRRGRRSRTEGASA